MLNGAEMRMLRWILGVTLPDRLRNDEVRHNLAVTKIRRKQDCDDLDILKEDGKLPQLQVHECTSERNMKQRTPKRWWMDKYRKISTTYICCQNIQAIEINGDGGSMLLTHQ